MITKNEDRSRNELQNLRSPLPEAFQAAMRLNAMQRGVKWKDFNEFVISTEIK